MSGEARLHPIGAVKRDSIPVSAADLPHGSTPTIPPVTDSAGPIKSYILPDGQTGAVSSVFSRTISSLLITVFRSMSAHSSPTTPTSSSAISSPQ